MAASSSSRTCSGERSGSTVGQVDVNAAASRGTSNEQGRCPESSSGGQHPSAPHLPPLQQPPRGPCGSPAVPIGAILLRAPRPPRVFSTPVPPPSHSHSTFPNRPRPHPTSASLSTRPSCITPTAFLSLALSRDNSADTCGTGTTDTKRACDDEIPSLFTRFVDGPCYHCRPRSGCRITAAPAAARPLIGHCSTGGVRPVSLGAL